MLDMRWGLIAFGIKGPTPQSDLWRRRGHDSCSTNLASDLPGKVPWWISALTTAMCRFRQPEAGDTKSSLHYASIRINALTSAIS